MNNITFCYISFTYDMIMIDDTFLLFHWLTGWWCNNHLEKYEFVNGKDDIPDMKWKIHV